MSEGGGSSGGATAQPRQPQSKPKLGRVLSYRSLHSSSVAAAAADDAAGAAAVLLKRLPSTVDLSASKLLDVYVPTCDRYGDDNVGPTIKSLDLIGLARDSLIYRRALGGRALGRR